MAKTATSIGVNVGNGPALSTYELLSGRQRQTAIIGDAESDVDRLVELPTHNEADRGSSIKIGGRAASVPPTVGLNDRTDAWFSINGELGVINTIEPATIYDAGRKAIVTAESSHTIAGAPLTVVSATASQKIKLLGAHVVARTVPGAGIIYFLDGNLTTVLPVDYFTTTGARTIGFQGQVIAQTATGTALLIHGAVAGTVVEVSIAYYKAA